MALQMVSLHSKYYILKRNLTILFILLSINMIGQDLKDSSDIIINQPGSVSDLIERHKQYIKDLETIAGYRVQIFTSTRLSESMKVKSKFEREYKKLSPYIIFSEPSFKVRIGDYTNKIEAYEIMQLLKKDYPEAFIVRAQIKIIAL